MDDAISRALQNEDNLEIGSNIYITKMWEVIFHIRNNGDPTYLSMWSHGNRQMFFYMGGLVFPDGAIRWPDIKMLFTLVYNVVRAIRLNCICGENAEEELFEMLYEEFTLGLCLYIHTHLMSWIESNGSWIRIFSF